MSELISDGRKLIRLASKRPDQMMVAYRANLKRGGQNVRDMILEDIRRFSELGALAYVDDLKEVLLRFDELAPFHPSAARSAVTVAY
ncbi:hypothetical protein AMST5_00702 [freshwater sediment metagenome]|jgi:hypothetical protein|uniref:Uncharacterized protein n=1 Tax=freshwater sediment metagenome TaxID=556182 RepID=A0AA48M071_9ZZZZ